MGDIYKTLVDGMSDLKNAEEVDVSGMDEFLEPKKIESHKKLPDIVKIASLGDLSDFFRIANNTLVHKAEKDLWRISENNAGDVVIERLFNPDTKEPVRV